MYFGVEQISKWMMDGGSKVSQCQKGRLEWNQWHWTGVRDISMYYCLAYTDR